MNPTVPNTEVIETLRAPEAWDAILQGTYRYTGNFSMYAGQYAPAEQRDIDIHVIYNENANCLQTWPGVMKGIEAFRKMDFVVTQGHFLNAVASYSDIVLPVTTVWEREDTSSGLNMFQREFIYLPKKVVDPLYEAQDDQWVAYELAKRLGLDADALFPYSGMQARYNVLASCTRTLRRKGARRCSPSRRKTLTPWACRASLRTRDLVWMTWARRVISSCRAPRATVCLPRVGTPSWPTRRRLRCARRAASLKSTAKNGRTW